MVLIFPINMHLHSLFAKNLFPSTVQLSSAIIFYCSIIFSNYFLLFNYLRLLRLGDRVGVVRHGNGDLHFSVNGVDQGTAATRVPSEVYGVVDLYGQAAQATIIPHPPGEGGDEDNRGTSGAEEGVYRINK